MVNMPPPSDWEHEVVIQQQQLEVLNILDDYMLQQCDNNGRPIGMVNLTREQALGRKEILQGIKTRKWKLYGTDKSEKLVLDTEANYMRAMAPHIESLDIVNYDHVLESEKLLNNHSNMRIRTVNMGLNAGSGQQACIVKAMQSHFAPLPQAKGARKDHKPLDPNFGYPMRVMMDGKKGPNGPLANIQSQILRPVRSALNQIVGTEVVNTEELCKVLEDHNTRIDLEPEVRVMPKRANKTPPLHSHS